MLCRPGEETAPAQKCTRAAGERAVVVSETPTYSYGPGAQSDTMTDATTFESLLLKYNVDLVVSGRLGWNARYWALAPGLHSPCPGGDYANAPGEDASRLCQGAANTGLPGSSTAANGLAAALHSLGAPAAPDPLGVSSQTGSAPLPFVVAASAGGRFGPAGGAADGTASQGYWHGYSVIRISADNPPGFAPIVEQRPVFDWISLIAPAHALKPGQRMQLKGTGREPVGTDTPIRYDDIQGPAITHRYDLLKADPAKPWLPLTDPSSPAPNHYVQLGGYMTDGTCADAVACVDQQSGKIQTGKGNHERVYAVAILSVGDKAASWPLVFEPRRSYVPTPPRIISAPHIPPLQPPPIRVLANVASQLPPPPQPPAVAPTVQALNFPPPPSLQPLPPVNAVPINPPPPPVPPPPPGQAAPSGLNLNLNIAGLNVPPPSSPIPPPSPPIQPAPPGGARKEARQRQAAAAKSEEGTGSERAGEAHGRIDAVDAPNQSMTRLDQGRGGLAFTALQDGHQASAWSRDVLVYGGGLTLAALVLALGFTTVRPKTRRREPAVPAIVTVSNRSGGRRS
jgi:hypothetical protein